MRKKLGLVCGLVVALICAFAVSAQTGLPEACPHCKAAVTWEPVTESVSTLTDGHYYLAFEEDSLTGGAITVSGKTCLYMNGKTLIGNHRVFSVSGELSLIGSGNVIGNSYANTSAYGGCVYIDGTLNLYGPTVTTAGSEGENTGRGGVVYVTGGTLNLYSGTVTGGHSVAGGTVYLRSSTANIYGGTISNGTASGNGGCVVLSTKSTLNMSGGSISGGTSGGYGGSIIVAENNTFNITGGTIGGGVAAAGGGVIYVNNNSTFNMSGGVIENGGEGTHSLGTCVFILDKGKANLSGDASIHELRFADLYTKPLCISGTYTGTVKLRAASSQMIDGYVIGTTKDTDLSSADITVGSTDLFVCIRNDMLRLSAIGDVKHIETVSKFCDVCNTDAMWVLLDDEALVSFTRLKTGHYLLESGISGCSMTPKAVQGTDHVCLDLNGQTVYADRAFNVESGVLNLMDTAGGGTVISEGPAVTSATNGGAVYVYQNATLNLYSGKLEYRLPTDGRPYVLRGGVIYARGQVNIYGGELVGGAANYGCSIFGNVDTTYVSHIRLYGGTVNAGQSVPGKTSTGLCVMSRGRVTVGGSCQVDEIRLETTTYSPAMGDRVQAEADFTGSVLLQLPAFEGCTDIGTGTASANITLGNGGQLMTLDGQLLAVSGAPAVITFHEDGTASSYGTLAAAIDACAVSDRLILLADVTEDICVDKLIHLDLNGFDVTGSVSGSGTLLCMDCRTDDFTVADGDYGRITGNASCTLAGVSAEAPCSEDNYLMIRQADGISFHRVRLAITDSVLRPACAGIYYRGDFYGDELAAAQIASFGVALNAAEVPTPENMETTTLYTTAAPALFNTDGTSCLLSGIMKAENTDEQNQTNAATAVYAGAYAKLTDGTVLFGEAQTTNLKEQAAAVNEGWPYLKIPQKKAFVTMYRSFEAVMSDESWTAANAASVAGWLDTFETTDYTPYITPWNYDVAADAKSDGKLHYYFMASEGLLISDAQSDPYKWGDCCLVVFPNGQTMLIDCGPAAYAPVLLENLQRMGIRHLDYVLITHPHSDHQYGIFHDSALVGTEFTKHISIGKVLYRGGNDPESTSATMVSRACEDLGIDYTPIGTGDVLQLGNVRMECLWPLPGVGDVQISGTQEVNDTSVVVRFDYGEHSSLFAADLYMQSEKTLMECVDHSLLDTDLLKAAHHGYNTSSALDFIETVSPQYVMATGGFACSSALCKRYATAGVEMLTDYNFGYVEITADTDGTMVYETSRDGVIDENAPEATPDED